MRRKDREITDFEQMRAILDACDCARLGLVDEQGAYIVPMNFGWFPYYEDSVFRLKSVVFYSNIKRCVFGMHRRLLLFL